MKETRYFYVPHAEASAELPAEEAAHAVRVLRMQPGDEMVLMDGCGTFYRAEITLAAPHHCAYKIQETLPQPMQWKGRLHIGVAPTKMMERMEWMLEKVTEIGIDAVSFLDCANSERRVVKTARLDKIIVSAMKQSRKAWKPLLNDMLPFDKVVAGAMGGYKYIAHCHTEIPRTYLFDELKGRNPESDVTVLIGPEGDFTMEEVMAAKAEGYVSVHLGDSRLRTETACMVAAMMMHLSLDV